MSQPTKAKAYRAGYRRAVRDAGRAIERLVDAVVLVETYAIADAPKAATMRKILNEVRHAVLWPLERDAKEVRP